MDILYLVGTGSKCDNFELKCSLRSIEKYGINVDRIFICGYCPDWLSDDVIKIEKPVNKSIDNFDKNKNIYKDLIYAVENTDIGINHNGDFLVSMDDHFYIKETDFDNYPYYVKDYIPRQCRHYLPLVFEPGFRCENYQRLLVSTANFLKDRGFSYINFTLHRNMHINRYVLLDEMKELNNEIFSNDNIFIEGNATVLNFMYTKHPFNYEIVKDNKSNNPLIIHDFIKTGEHVFSTSNFSFDNKNLYMYLCKLYPNKSKYEK